MRQSFTSVRNLINAFDINPIQAVLIRQLIQGKIELEDSLFFRNLFPNTFSWIDQCYHNPLLNGGYNAHTEIVLECINEILRGYGTECINSEDTWSHYWGNSVFSYVNMGDTYNTTILYDTRKDRFIVSDWGSIVESTNLGE